MFRHSQAEVNLALEHGVPPDNIILSGVCKQLALVKAAAKHEVRHLVCENEAELAKIARLHPRAKSVERTIASWRSCSRRAIRK